MVDSVIALLERFRSSVKMEDYDFFRSDSVPFLLPVEKELADTLPRFVDMTPDDWSVLRESVDLELASMLLTFGLRMATMAVRSASEEYISAGVMGLVLDDDLLDFRDVSVVLCVLGDAANRVNAPFHLICERAGTLAARQRAGTLATALSGPSYVRSIRSMGFQAVDAPQGFVYRAV